MELGIWLPDLNKQKTTLLTKTRARKELKKLIREDPDWHYEVVKIRDKYAISVFDEQGNHLGHL